MKETTQKANNGEKPIAYSYIRFSTPEHLDGDSLRRQTEAARAWCGRNGISLNTNTTFRDLGRSGFTGEHLKNKELGGLATFLAMVEAGKIPKGSFLIVENADRLTRQKPWDAIGLFHDLVKADVRIVLLSPVEQIIDRSTDGIKMMWLLMELSRGHGESGRKQELIGKNWERWRREAPQTKEPRPGKSPFWIDREGDGYILNEDKANIVRLVYKLAGEGWGFIRIARHLRELGIRPISPCKRSDGFFVCAYREVTLGSVSSMPGWV
jgi:DNA invertase Pin-like site-specific DNA recombinase